MNPRDISEKNLVSTARPVREADNVTAICQPTVYTVWDPQHLATQSSTACYGKSFYNNNDNVGY
jgi:hypothetical protein